MAKSNLSLSAIDELTIDDISKLLLNDLATLHAEARDAAGTARDRVTKIIDALELRFAADAQAKLLAEKKDAGTVHIRDSGFDVTRLTKKNVKYDQQVMLSIYNRIVAAGENPGTFMKASYAVITEAAYNEWPLAIKQEFDVARTVTPSRAEYTFTVAKD